MLSGEQGNFVRLRWDQALSGVRGAYGYYQVRSNEPYPKLGFITEGDVSVNNYGLFIQDAWTLSNKLTLNLGLRTENEKVPTYTTAEGVPTYGVEFPFSDKLAPRLGFAYDVKGDGRWKVYGSWGIFYDIFKLELPRGSWGGDKWLEYLLLARHVRVRHAGQLARAARRRARARCSAARSTSVTRRSARATSSPI